MRAALLLSINAFAARKTRSALLVAAVALSTALIAAVACAMASLNAGIASRISDRVGTADVRVRHVANDRFDAELLDRLRAMDEIAAASPRVRGAIRISSALADLEGERSTLTILAIDPGTSTGVGVPAPERGALPAAADEIVIDANTAQELGVDIGDVIPVEQHAFGNRGRVTVDLTLVGLTPNLTLEILDRPQGIMTRDGLANTAGVADALSEIQIVLEPGVDAEAFANALGPTLPPNLLAEPTALVTSGLDSMLQGNQITFYLALALSTLTASFIVLTGLTSTSAERQRELAIIRCIGARRQQLAVTQIALGTITGLGGALFGVPLGVALAWLLAVIFPDRLPSGFELWPLGLVLATAGALASGIIGALWSAWRASRTQPLPSMKSRAAGASTRSIVLAGVAGLIGIAAQFAVVALAPSADALVQTYLAIGLPAMFVGYFLLAVPMCLFASRLLARPLAGLLRVPPAVLGETFASAPFRNGFTAGALMLGLAMMVSMWTNGRAILRDWFDAIRFPDAFVNGLLTEITPDARHRVDQLDIVQRTAAITLFKTQTEAFGLDMFSRPKTSFIAFDPDEFFPMAKLHWAAGDPETAIPRLNEGGAVLVAQEFLVEREGFGIGSTFTIEHKGREIPFEIVGAVSSPGLDVVSKYFDLGEEYADHAIHSVFGTRADLEKLFGDTSIDLIQIQLAPGLDELSDQDAVRQIREALNLPGAFVGSGREIKANITSIGVNSLRVGSIIAMAAMLIGSLGVGNIVVASIDARRFEFGVLRSIGAGRWTVARLIVGEVVLIAAVACILGTLMGLQSAYAGARLYELVAGLDLRVLPPVGPITLGSLALIVITLGVSAPIIIGLARRKPRELLAASAA